MQTPRLSQGAASKLRFGWTIRTNNESIRRAIESSTFSERAPKGLGVADGNDYFVQPRRDQQPGTQQIEVRKNASPVFEAYPAMGVNGGDRIHEFEKNFLAQSSEKMAEDLAQVIQKDLS